LVDHESSAIFSNDGGNSNYQTLQNDKSGVINFYGDPTNSVQKLAKIDGHSKATLMSGGGTTQATLQVVKE